MRIGIDLGGTKIEAIALDEDGSVLLRERIAAPRGDYEATVDAIASLVGNIEQRLQRNGTVGVGMPDCALFGFDRNAPQNQRTARLQSMYVVAVADAKHIYDCFLTLDFG